jgi:hypothetical protein
MVEKEKRFSPGSFWLLAALSKICDEELIFKILGTSNVQRYGKAGSAGGQV